MGNLKSEDLKGEMSPGRHGDGNGLYLQVQGPQQRSWLLRYTLRGRTREMGLGPFPAVGLTQARRLAAEQRALLLKGIDPLEARRAATAPPVVGMTFREAAARRIAAKSAKWTNPKHAAQWKSTLERYAYKLLGEKLCREITTADVEAVLRPIWSTKTETASRLRGRIEDIIDAAHALEEWQPYKNPAAWRGNLKRLFDSRREIAPVESDLAPLDAPGMS